MTCFRRRANPRAGTLNKNMASTSERLAELQKQIKEYEQVIASFESTNGNLRMRRTNASPEIREFCDRHIELNSRTIAARQSGLALKRRQLAEAIREPNQRTEH